MNITLCYPELPYKVSFTNEQFEELIDLHNGNDDCARAIGWLVDRNGGPLLITTTSDNPLMPFEKPIAYFSCTSDANCYALENLLEEPDHIGTGDNADVLECGAVHFNFADKDVALLFKLTFGGAA